MMLITCVLRQNTYVTIALPLPDCYDKPEVTLRNIGELLLNFLSEQNNIFVSILKVTAKQIRFLIDNTAYIVSSNKYLHIQI